MATIKDIAQITGVSTATVSNVLNGKEGAASPAKAREIIEVAQDLHYTPNTLAKGLKQRKTNNIGVISEDLTVFNTPEIVDGIESFCEESGYEIILGNMRLFKRYNNDFTDTPQHQKLLNTMVANMLAKQVAGIVYVGYHCREINYIPKHLPIPLSYAYCYPKNNLYPSVILDDETAAREVTNLLIKNGHHKIGIIAGPPGSMHTVARLTGFQKALYENRILFNTDLVLYGDWERKSGYDCTDCLLNAGVSAIFAFNDPMASGVYLRCLEKGIAIGRDLSLFGFDNRDISMSYLPQIATVAPPLNAIGRRSVQIVLDQIAHKKVSYEIQQLPCTILNRESLGKNLQV